MARINQAELQLIVEKQITKTRAFRKAAIARANEVFEEAKEEFLTAFDDHDVTQEIKLGPGASSSFMPGGYGNLFSFLGFYADEDPIAELRAFLKRNIDIIQSPTTQEKRYLFRVNVPSKDEIYEVTPMPWGTSRSWVYSLEQGVPGFNRYLFDLGREFSDSRSEVAVQTSPRHILRSGAFRAVSYLSALFQDFKRNLRG